MNYSLSDKQRTRIMEIASEPFNPIMDMHRKADLMFRVLKELAPSIYQNGFKAGQKTLLTRKKPK